MADSNESFRAFRTAQRHSLLGIVSMFISLCLLVGYSLTMDNRHAETITQLSLALTQQREQFNTCTANEEMVLATRCEEPVTEKPEEIVEEVEDSTGNIDVALKPPVYPAGTVFRVLKTEKDPLVRQEITWTRGPFSR